MDTASTARHFDLTDKVIVVTGGSRGLGLAMCHAFAQAGFFQTSLHAATASGASTC